MVNVLDSSLVDCGFKSLLIQTNNYELCICCFSTKPEAFSSKTMQRLVGSIDDNAGRVDQPLSASRPLFQY
jgi:hypothetical protein